MEQLEKLIQLVTDRVMAEIEPQPDKEQFTFVGKTKDYISRYYEERGFQQVAPMELSTPEVVIVTELELYQMTRLAGLMPINETEEALLNRLMQQKTVVVLEEGIEKAFMPKSMQAPFEKAKVELRKWGVQFKQESAFHHPAVTQTAPTTQKKKELITAAKIQNKKLSAGDTFYATPDMIITALAKDYLREQNIQLEVRDAE